MKSVEILLVLSICLGLTVSRIQTRDILSCSSSEEIDRERSNSIRDSGEISPARPSNAFINSIFAAHGRQNPNVPHKTEPQDSVTNSIRCVRNNINKIRRSLDIMSQEINTCSIIQKNSLTKVGGTVARDCLDHFNQGSVTSGIFTIVPDKEKVQVYCDMITAPGLTFGGWTVIQRRGTVKQPYEEREDFYRGWDEYAHGFGNVSTDSYLGNDNIALISNFEETKLLVELEDWNGLRYYAFYKTFRVGYANTNYTLLVLEYSGTAGDSLAYHNGMQFSTKDRDNDKDPTPDYNCAVAYHGAWWYNGCHASNLNGLYAKDDAGGHVKTWAQGIVWYSVNKDWYYSFKTVSMKIQRWR